MRELKPELALELGPPPKLPLVVAAGCLAVHLIDSDCYFVGSGLTPGGSKWLDGEACTAVEDVMAVGHP